MDDRDGVRVTATMLFTVKRNTAASLGLCVAFVLAALLGRSALDLTWSLETTGRVLPESLGAAAVMLLSDGIVHLLLVALGGEAYLDTYRGLVEYFRGQSRWAIIAGGVLAAGEELLFRGVVLLGLLALPWVPVPAAVLASALAFGAAHYIPEPGLRRMTLWAVGEGLLLGAALVATGSLVVPLVAHALHDVVGFSLFAWQREHGVRPR